MIIFAAFAISTLTCAAVLLTKPLHLHVTAKGHCNTAKQSSHKRPTPRVGGLGLLAFAFVGVFWTEYETARLILLLSLSSLPVFIGGFGEDTGFDVSPKIRLVLSFASAAAAGILLGAWISKLDIPFLDFALSLSAVSIVFTMLMSGGICHAINLVDGLNGLSIGLSIMMASALAFIATIVGDTTMVSIILILLGSLAGILIFNFPFGKIFLGDAGAYTMGHLLTWISILILVRNPTVAPFSIFLIFFWPVADMLFAILRRIRRGAPIDQPDRMHFHQFVMRAIELTLVSRRTISNPLAATVIWPLAALPMIIAIIFHESNIISMIAWVIYFILFVATYVAGIRIARFLTRARKGNEKLTETISRQGFANLHRAATNKSNVFPAE